jgi:hypothetical protein
VIERAKQRRIAREPEEAVVRLGPLADLVGELPHPPIGVVLEVAAGLDPRSGLGHDLLATLVRGLRIEHQDQLVHGCRDSRQEAVSTPPHLRLASAERWQARTQLAWRT